MSKKVKATVEYINGMYAKLEGDRQATAAELELFLDNMNPLHADVQKQLDEYVTKMALISEKLKIYKFLSDNYKDES